MVLTDSVSNLCRFDQWIEETHYSRKKKERYKLKVRNMRQQGDGRLQAKHFFVKCFIKNESYNCYKIPRAILARTDEFKCVIGPFIHQLEKILYNFKNANGHFEFIKTLPFCDRAKYLSSKFGLRPGFIDRPTEILPRILITDFSSFEASFSEPFMKNCEFRFYYRVALQFVEGLEIMKTLKRILGVNTLIFSSYLATVLARRMSGEMNTSLGNGFSNNMLIKFVLFLNGITIFELIVEGDDSLVCYNGPIFDDTVFVSLGFVIKMKYVESINLASFCGQIYNPVSFVVFTDPIKFVLNFAWLSMKFRNVPIGYIKELLKGKALCALYQYAGCPIVQPFVLRVLYLTKDCNTRLDTSADAYKQQIYSEMIEKFKAGKIRPLPITIESRHIMADAFGVAINDQIIMEHIFSTMAFGPVVCPPIMLYCHQDALHFDFNYVRIGGLTKKPRHFDYYQ